MAEVSGKRKLDPIAFDDEVEVTTGYFEEEPEDTRSELDAVNSQLTSASLPSTPSTPVVQRGENFEEDDNDTEVTEELDTTDGDVEDDQQTVVAGDGGGALQLQVRNSSFSANHFISISSFTTYDHNSRLGALEFEWSNKEVSLGGPGNVWSTQTPSEDELACN